MTAEEKIELMARGAAWLTITLEAVEAERDELRAINRELRETDEEPNAQTRRIPDLICFGP